MLARALRLLFAQLKFLKLDAANAHLTMLARTMGRDQAVECASGLLRNPAPMLDFYYCYAQVPTKLRLRGTSGVNKLGAPRHLASVLYIGMAQRSSTDMASIAQVCSADLRKAMEPAIGFGSRRGCRPPAPHASVACISVRSAAARRERSGATRVEPCGARRTIACDAGAACGHAGGQGGGSVARQRPGYVTSNARGGRLAAFTGRSAADLSARLAGPCAAGAAAHGGWVATG